MGRRSKGASPIESNIFCGILYPDAENYVLAEVLDRLKDKFTEWAYIIHDSDIEDDGNPKKTHVHWVARRDSDVPLSTVSIWLGVTENYIQYAKSFKSSVRYLVHADSPEKYQYSKEKILTNINLVRYFAEDKELMYFKNLVDFMYSDECKSMNDLTFFAMRSGALFSTYRRNWSLLAHMFTLLKSEKN